MSDDASKQAEHPAPAAPKKRRGRPAGSTNAAKAEGKTRVAKQAETPQQRIDRLKAELQKAEEEKAAMERQRDAIIGKAVVAHALADNEFRKQLGALLMGAVTNKADAALLREFMPFSPFAELAGR
jgi:hypothetical protein